MPPFERIMTAAMHRSPTRLLAYCLMPPGFLSTLLSYGSRHRSGNLQSP
jgi:hypothetical protein